MTIEELEIGDVVWCTASGYLNLNIAIVLSKGPKTVLTTDGRRSMHQVCYADPSIQSEATYQWASAQFQKQRPGVPIKFKVVKI